MKKLDPTATSLNQVYGLDVLKFLMATMIIILHTIPMTLYDGNYFTYGVLQMPLRLCVPMFFCLSSFFFFRKILNAPKEKYNKICLRYLKRLVVLYGIWSIIYFLVNSFDWHCDGYFDFGAMQWYIKYCILWSKFGVLWFLQALIISIVLTYSIWKYISYRLLLMLSVMLVCFTSIADAWFGIACKNDLVKCILEKFYLYFITTRSGIFFGIPFVTLGLFFAIQEKNNRNCNHYIRNSCGLIASFLALSIEGYYLRTYPGGASPCDYGLFLFTMPVIYFLFMLFYNLKLKEDAIYVYLRKASSLMYFIHMNIIFVWDRAFRLIGEGNSLYRSLLGATFVFIGTMFFSTLIWYLSNKQKFRFFKFMF